MANNLTNEEKKRLSNERQKAVRNAWREEKERVKTGRGTRDWSLNQQKELVNRGAVSGYEGHHMKSVSLYPEYAGDPKNIQFLSEQEHFEAHQCNYHNATNGYYDPKTHTMIEFEGAELKNVPVDVLSEYYADEQNLSVSQVREAYVSDDISSEESKKTEGLSYSKAIYAESFTTYDERENSVASKSNSEDYGIGR
jgi:hypothetical protein